MYDANYFCWYNEYEMQKESHILWDSLYDINYIVCQTKLEKTSFQLLVFSCGYHTVECGRHITFFKNFLIGTFP